MLPLDISLCMIVKNEETHLARCLESVKNLVSEILIGDTGSSDRTSQIAASFGARIIPIAWENHFAEARNQVLLHASCSWILVLDADEEADTWDSEQLVALINNEQTSGYFIPFVSYYGQGSEEDYFTDAVCRLFRNHPFIRFRGAIHENAAESIIELTGQPIPFAPMKIKHYGYMQSELERKHKHQRNEEIIRSELRQKPLDLQLRYALGVEYFQEGQYAASLEHFMPVLDLHRHPEPGYLPDVYLKTAYASHMTGLNEMAEQIAARGLKEYSDFTDLQEFKALMLYRAGQYEEAYQSMLRAAALGVPHHKYSTSSGSGTFRTQWLAGRLSEKLLKPEQALVHYKHVLLTSQNFLPAWSDALQLSLLLRRSDTWFEWLVNSVSPLSPEKQNLLIATALTTGEDSLLDFVSKLPTLDKSRRSWIALMRQYAPEPGSRLYEEIVRCPIFQPDDPFYLAYLWAAAWKAGEEEAAEPLAERMRSMHSPLGSMHGYLTGLTSDPPEPIRMLTVLQIFLQCRAYAQAGRLLAELTRQRSIHSFSTAVTNALISAPVQYIECWCLNWMETASETESPSMAELLLYAALGVRCGSKPCLEMAVYRLEQCLDEPYALAAKALCRTEMAKLYHPLMLQQKLSFPLLLRAVSIHL